MARPRKNEASVSRGINMPLALASQFELLEHDPMTGKVKYGAWTALLENALNDYLAGRRAGIHSTDLARNKVDLIKELQLLRDLVIALQNKDREVVQLKLGEYYRRYPGLIARRIKEIEHELEVAEQGG